VPDETIYRLTKLPSFELANCHILGAMIRPLREEVSLIRFCDLVEDLVDDLDSKEFIDKLRNGQLVLSKSYGIFYVCLIHKCDKMLSVI